MIAVKRTWFEVDARALGAFRIALGATILLDLVRRVPYVDLFWSGTDAVFPPPPEGALASFSLLSGAHPPALAWALLVVSVVAAALFTAGRWPRVAGLVTLVGLLSFHANRFGLETGASQVLRLALMYALLLPTDLRYAWRGRGRMPEPPAPVRSIAVLALLLQLGLIYFNAAAARGGPSWLAGTAIHDMLELDSYVTPLGAWLRGPIMDAASPALSDATLALEVLGPLLMLLPVAPALLRGVTLVALFGFHLCILLLIDVGLFSASMFCLLLLFVPGPVFDALSRRFGRALPTPGTAAPPGRWQRWPVEAVALMLLVANVWLGVHRNQLLGPELREAGLGAPAALDIALARLEISQTWRMFAPNVSRVDQVVLVPATTASGRVVDLLTGAPPDFGHVGPDRLRGQFWSKYFERLSNGAASPEALRTRLVARWNAAQADPIVRAEVVLLREHTPDLGQTAPGPPEATILLGAESVAVQ